jgi:hypothetical protein
VKRNIEALKQLKRVVRNAPMERFNMVSQVIVRRDEVHECGTAMCAAGWASVDPWFSQRGFRGDEMFKPNIFGLSAADSRALFGGGLYPGCPRVSKRMVLANINRLINGEDALPYPRRFDYTH